MFASFKKWISENPGKFLGLILPLFAGMGTSVGLTVEEAVSAYLTGSEYGESVVAEEQKTLWKKNLTCLQNVKPVSIKNDHNIEVSTIVCPSGDVLVTAQKPGEADHASKWIGVDNLFQEETGVINFSFAPTAYADDQITTWDPTDVQQVWLKCTYWSGDYLVKVMTDGIGCMSYVVNPYTGQTVKRFQGCSCGG